MEINTPQPEQDSTDAVLLKHTLSDGSFHYDWMIEIPGLTSEYRLLTFRCKIRPDLSTLNQSFHALQLGNHRAHYLEYEGDIGLNRGQVRRLGTGHCLSYTLTKGSSIRLVLRWAGSDRPATEYIGETLDRDQWLFHVSK